MEKKLVYTPDLLNWWILDIRKSRLTKILAEINLIANNVYKEIGGFHSESIYQEAFEKELQNNSDKFKYIREYEMPVFFKDDKVGIEKPDFIVVPDKKFFNLSNGEAEAIFIEIKKGQKNLNRDIIDFFESGAANYEDEDGYLNPEKYKIENNLARQQLWKYFKTASISNDSKIKKIHMGLLLNFSKELSFVHDDNFLYFEDINVPAIEFYFFGEEKFYVAPSQENSKSSNILNSLEKDKGENSFMLLVAHTIDISDAFKSGLIELD